MPSSRVKSKANERRLSALYIAKSVERKPQEQTVIVHKKVNNPIQRQAKKEVRTVTDEQADFVGLMTKGVSALGVQVKAKIKGIADEAEAKAKTLDAKLSDIEAQAKGKLKEQDVIIDEKLKGFVDSLGEAKKEINGKIDALRDDIKRIETALNTFSKSIARRVSVTETELGITMPATLAPPAPPAPKTGEQAGKPETAATPAPVGKLVTIEQRIEGLTKQVGKLIACITSIGDLCQQKKG